MLIIRFGGQALICSGLCAILQIGRVIRNPVLMRLIHQRAAEQIVGAAFVARHWNVPDRRDAQQCLDVRVVRLLLTVC